MTESALDLAELEKIRSADDNEAESSNLPAEFSHKYQILLEPVLLCSMLAYNLQETSLINFYLRTACSVDLGYSSNICNTGVGEKFRAAELASQVVVAGVSVSKSFIGSLISNIVLLFAGPWSDCSRRRQPILILPLLGTSAATTCVLLLLTFPGANAAQVLYMVQIPASLGGKFALLTAASYSYIGDVRKIYYVFSALESASQMLSSPLFALLYKKSVASLPDAWLIPGIILTLIQFFSYFYARKLDQICR